MMPVSECQESFPRNSRAEFLKNSNFKFPAKTDYRFDEVRDGKIRLEDFWYSTVSQYSQLKLTYPSKDYMVAIKGVREELIGLVKPSFDKDCRNLPRLISGLWLTDIHHCLLWDIQQPIRNSGCYAPSWSWLSQLGHVVWPDLRHRCYGTNKSLEITQIRYRDGTEQSVKDMLREQSSTEGSIDAINPVASLVVKAKLFPILVGGLFPSTVDFEITALSTDVTWHLELDEITIREILSLETNSRIWRTLYHPSSPDLIRGWATFNRPEVQAQFQTYEWSTLIAMLVSVDVGAGRRYGLSRHLKGNYDLANVLFLRCDGEKYWRIGKGVIFSPELVRDLERAEMVELEFI